MVARRREQRMRTEIQWFAGEMEKRLKANESKRSWKKLTSQWLFSRLINEVEELRHTGHFGCATCGKPRGMSSHPYYKEVIKEAADVANFAMMIADLALSELAALEDPHDVPPQQKGESR